VLLAVAPPKSSSAAVRDLDRAAPGGNVQIEGLTVEFEGSVIDDVGERGKVSRIDESAAAVDRRVGRAADAELQQHGRAAVDGRARVRAEDRVCAAGRDHRAAGEAANIDLLVAAARYGGCVGRAAGQDRENISAADDDSGTHDAGANELGRHSAVPLCLERMGEQIGSGMNRCERTAPTALAVEAPERRCDFDFVLALPTPKWRVGQGGHAVPAVNGVGPSKRIALATWIPPGGSSPTHSVEQTPVFNAPAAPCHTNYVNDFGLPTLSIYQSPTGMAIDFRRRRLTERSSIREPLEKMGFRYIWQKHTR